MPVKFAGWTPKALAFIARPPEKDAWINILEGAVRSGKTWAMIGKLLKLCLYDVPGSRVMIGVSKASLMRNVLNDLFMFVGHANYSYNTQSGELWIYGVKWEVIGAGDEGAAKKIQGMTIGVAYVDEATRMPQSAWEMLTTRLSLAGSRLYATCNPDSPYHYLKAKWLDDAEKRRKGYVWSEHFGLEDNLSLGAVQIDRLKASYTGVFHQRFILGQWVIAEGAVYGNCFDERSFYDDNTRPLGLYGAGGHFGRYISVDYGTTNPCVFLDIWASHDDRGKACFWVDREYYWDSKEKGRQKTDREYADDLLDFIKKGTPEAPLNELASRVYPNAIIVDPSAASFKVELNQRGLIVQDANNDVLDGIRKTASLLAQKKMRFNRANTPHTVAEFHTYAWNDKRSAVGEEEPIKAHDHGPDAGRYFVETIVDDWSLAA